MKKIAIISLLLLVCPLIRATEYTVDKVPNVHLDDGRRFVSNPDGILSAETVNTLDQMLFSPTRSQHFRSCSRRLTVHWGRRHRRLRHGTFYPMGNRKTKRQRTAGFVDTRPTQNYIPHRVWYRRNITRCYL